MPEPKESAGLDANTRVCDPRRLRQRRGGSEDPPYDTPIPRIDCQRPGRSPAFLWTSAVCSPPVVFGGARSVSRVSGNGPAARPPGGVLCCARNNSARVVPGRDSTGMHPALPPMYMKHHGSRDAFLVMQCPNALHCIDAHING
uniref:Uncharacterized protein n=1 Tax=Eutreptiella gymnastica TaxID=73025 RepID=A0A7S4LDE5_9EUGL